MKKLQMTKMSNVIELRPAAGIKSIDMVRAMSVAVNVIKKIYKTYYAP